ncbi:threonine--tRNA ligase [Candidatus Woesearchaeota archaeon]|nr:threonine--tRNA ligase [Candidatus Woesearchaeota archaeon]
MTNNAANNMITIEFPDGSKRQFPENTTGIQIAESISQGLARETLAIKFNDKIMDAFLPLTESGKLKLFTFKDKEGVEVFRHSSAHLLAHAIIELFPEAKLTIGPVVEEGFFYDIDHPAFHTEDLEKIEKRMKEIVDRKLEVARKEYPIGEALKLFENNQYKVELIKELANNGEKTVSVYHQGKFFDLCTGPHVPNTGKIKAVKLMKLAGAYWRGDIKNKQLQRIYGISFADKKDLNEYLRILEEAKKRDHRKLGKELDLFFFSDLVGVGLTLWTPKGTMLRNLLDDYVWQLRKERGYQKVTIPHLTKKDLYMTSGHWQKYSEDLYKIKTRDGHEFAMKPMNCPHHTQIYGHLQRSYRELPQRYTETTMVYRDEQTGELSGLSRVLCITQDDAHVFCRESQLKEEFFKIWDIINIFYESFGFDLKIRLSLHDPQQFNKYIGSKESWEFAENQLRQFVKTRRCEAVEVIGEAAFYGPKVDFIAQDSLGRKWQVATIQIDRSMPERFDLFCMNEKGEKERITMIHAAIMGSIERLLSVLIEHFAGKFPLWLTPEQVRIVTVSDAFNSYAEKLQSQFINNNIRAEIDSRAETMNKKIREAQLDYVPIILTVGEKEVANNTVALRTLDGQVKFNVSIYELLQKLNLLIKERKLKIDL